MNSTKIIQIVLLVFLTVSCSLNKHHRRFLVESETMLPTIAPGDYVVIDTNTKFFTYGDIIAYQYEGGYDGDFWVEPFSDAYRIVALPNDSIAVEKNICIVNGKKNQSKFIKISNLNLSDEYEEILPNGITIKVHHDPSAYDPAISDLKPIKLKQGRYFIMGDYRTGTLDSRFFGAVPKDKITGKVIEIIK